MCSPTRLEALYGLCTRLLEAMPPMMPRMSLSNCPPSASVAVEQGCVDVYIASFEFRKRSQQGGVPSMEFEKKNVAKRPPPSERGAS